MQAAKVAMRAFIGPGYYAMYLVVNQILGTVFGPLKCKGESEYAEKIEKCRCEWLSFPPQLAAKGSHKLMSTSRQILLCRTEFLEEN